MSCKLVAKIAVEKAVYSFDREFDYAVPDALFAAAAVGKRVLVPFGRGNSRRQGIITALAYEEAEGLKPVLAVTDETPVLSPEMLAVARFMKEHYFCTLYDAVKTMLPAGINYRVTTVYGVRQTDEAASLTEEEQRLYDYLKKKRGAVKLEKLTEDFGLADSSLPDELTRRGLLYKSEEVFRKVNDAVMKMAALSPDFDPQSQKLTPKQQEITELLAMSGAVSVREIRYFTGVSSSVIDALFKKGVIYFFDEEVFRTGDLQVSGGAKPIVLSGEQQQACDNLLAEYRDTRPHVSLLYGVTGSGKTSVFLKLIERVLDEGRGIIVMVPEISLTPQFVEQFARRFGDKIAVFHSALSLGERLDAYKRVKKGLAQIVIGTRSAVFAPFDDVGLVIMDEEQEYSYKSESAPRYHAREIAMFRCAQHNALLVLSSATPSVETYYYAQNGRYSLNVLTQLGLLRCFAAKYRKQSGAGQAVHSAAQPARSPFLCDLYAVRRAGHVSQLLHLADLSQPQQPPDVPLLRLFRSLQKRVPHLLWQIAAARRYRHPKGGAGHRYDFSECAHSAHGYRRHLLQIEL